MEGKTEQLHDEIHARYGAFFLGLRNRGMKPEVKWGLNAKWEACEFDDEDCMLRGVMDGVLEHHVYEFKTGKRYEEHFDQMTMYGMAQLIRHPDVDSVTVTNIYFDSGSNRQHTYSRDMLGNYMQGFYHKVMQVLNEKEYAPNPSYACRWCDFSRQKGGPCEF
jgi:hypothetical protein